MSDKPEHSSAKFSCPLCRGFFTNFPTLQSHLEAYLTPSNPSQISHDFEDFNPIPLAIQAYVTKTAESLQQFQQESVSQFSQLVKNFFVIMPSRIKPFGSFLCKTQVSESDIDLSIAFPYNSIMTDSDLAKFEEAVRDCRTRERIFDEFVLRLLQAYLETKRIATIFCPGRVKTLKVKLPVKGFDLCFDLSLNNEIAVRNSQLIAEYIRIFPPMKPLCLVVKHWARTYGIMSAVKHFISSYAYVILIIFYLQRSFIVPNLQVLATKSDLIQGWECKFLRNSAPVYCDLPFETLLTGFFEFMCRTDWTQLVVCISLNSLKTFKMKLAERSCKWQRRHMWIEDPFIPTRNLGDVMQEPANKAKFMGQFTQAYAVLESRDPAAIEDHFKISLAEMLLIE
jgi:DNA polymerase sigma